MSMKARAFQPTYASSNSLNTVLSSLTLDSTPQQSQDINFAPHPPHKAFHPTRSYSEQIVHPSMSYIQHPHYMPSQHSLPVQNSFDSQTYSSSPASDFSGLLNPETIVLEACE